MIFIHDGFGVFLDRIENRSNRLAYVVQAKSVTGHSKTNLRAVPDELAQPKIDANERMK